MGEIRGKSGNFHRKIREKSALIPDKHRKSHISKDKIDLTKPKFFGLVATTNIGKTAAVKGGVEPCENAKKEAAVKKIALK